MKKLILIFCLIFLLSAMKEKQRNTVNKINEPFIVFDKGNDDVTDLVFKLNKLEHSLNNLNKNLIMLDSIPNKNGDNSK